MYKILIDKYDNSIIPKLGLNETRSNNLKLNTLESKYDLRKYSFCVRVPKIRNTLSSSVINSNTVNSFKNYLDHFWAITE